MNYKKLPSKTLPSREGKNGKPAYIYVEISNKNHQKIANKLRIIEIFSLWLLKILGNGFRNKYRT
jgi:hypothetical protein